MWRALFLAVGISMCIIGAECLVVERAVLASPVKPADSASIGFAPATAPRREIKPPEWAPWTLLSGGAVIVLYSFSIPRRISA